MNITFVSLSVLIACVVVGLTMFLSQLEALNAQASQTRLQLRDRFKEYLVRFIHQGPNTAEFIYNYCINDHNDYEHHFVNKNQQLKARQMYTRFMQATPEITGIFHGNNANGDIYGVQKMGTNSPYEGVTGAGNLVWEVFLYNLTTGDRTTFRSNLTKSDVRTRAWWLWAKSHPGITWMPSFFSIRAQQFAISTVFTFGNMTSGNFVTSFQVQFSLDSISHFLANMEVSTQTRLFLLDMDSNYIGTNVGGVWNFVNNKTSMEKVYGGNHTDLIIRDSFKALVKEYGSVANIEGLNSLTFVSSDGETRHMELMLIKDAYELRWVAGVVVSSSEINKPLYNSSIIAACVCIFIIIAFPIAVSIVIGCTLMPLNKIISQMTLVEQMQLESINTDAMKSFLQEVYSIQSAFFLMVLRLREYKAFLPSYILDRDFGEKQEETLPATSSSRASLADHHSIAVDMKSTATKSPLLKQGSLFSAHSSKNGIVNSSFRRKSTATSMAATTNAMLALGLDQKEISILLVKIENIDELFGYYSPGNFIDVHGKILDDINRYARATKGDITRFASEYFLISWNAAATSKSPAASACHAAIAIRDGLQKIFHDLQRDQMIAPTVTMTITTDMAYVGNVGTVSKRMFDIIGTVITNNTALSYLHKEWPNCIITDSKTLTSASTNYEFRTIPHFGDISPSITTTTILETPFQAYDLIEEKQQKHNDEWMYEMKQTEELKVSKFEQYELGYTAMRERHFKEAYDHFEAFLKVMPNDALSKKLMQICTNNMIPTTATETS